MTVKIINNYAFNVINKAWTLFDLGANILRDHHGNLKLGDFGAAKLLQSQSIAETSKIAGTPYFMAPEVIRGEACGCRSDIW